MKVPRMIDWCSEDVSWVFLGCLKVVKKGRSKQVLFLSYFVSFALLQIFQCFLCIFCTFFAKIHFFAVLVSFYIFLALLFANYWKIVDKQFANG